MKSAALAKDLVSFLWERKLWWLVPIVIMLIIVLLLMFFGQNAVVSQFVYTLF